jgi:cell division septal protein FtsQ
MKRRQRIFVLAFVFSGLAALLWSPLFYVDSVRVEGNHYASQDEINYYTAPFNGKNVFLVRFVYDVKTFLTNHLVEIQSADYHYAWPNKLTIKIIEKEPWISFLVDGKSVLVAKDGTLLSDGSRELTADFSADVWIVRGFPNSYFLDPKMPGDLISHIRKVITSIQAHYEHPSLQLDFRGEDDWALIQDDMLPIEIGSLEDLDQKFRALHSFFVYYDSLKRKKTLASIDLRVPGKLFVTYAK